MSLQSPALPSKKSRSPRSPLYVLGPDDSSGGDPHRWLGKLAVAHRVTAALVELVCEQSGVEAPKDVARLLARLTSEGVLRVDCGDATGDTFRLDTERQDAMLAELADLPGGIREVRNDLIRLGVADVPETLSGQLAI